MTTALICIALPKGQKKNKKSWTQNNQPPFQLTVLFSRLIAFSSGMGEAMQKSYCVCVLGDLTECSLVGDNWWVIPAKGQKCDSEIYKKEMQ